MMKKIFLPILFLLSFVSYSQDITIKSFYQDDSDLTANTAGTTELDLNGEKCALIKILTTQTDFTFDAGMLGVVKSIQKDGEVWLYVPAGVKRLSVNHVGMLPLRDYDLGMSLKSAKTYIMTISTSKDVVMQNITVRVEPVDAMISIESKDKSFSKITSGTETLKVPVGEYTYRAMHPGYSMDEGSFVVTASNSRTLSVVLTPDGTSAPTPAPAPVPQDTFRYVPISLGNVYQSTSEIPEFKRPPSGSVYSILLFQYPHEVDQLSIFKGVAPLMVYKENGEYLYLAGTYRTFEEAKQDLSKVKRLFKSPRILGWTKNPQ